MEKRNDRYWEQKLCFFLHDPIDKALKIPGHEGRAEDIADAFGTSTPDKAEVDLCDIIAAGLDRASLPGYSSDKSKNGAIDFSHSPQITHPVSGGSPLKFVGDFESANNTTRQIAELIKKDTNRLDTIWNKQTYFNYLFFVLRKRIITQNCGSLGYLWDRLPADSRIPDHSIWNHCGMVSALCTSFAESDLNSASMVVFSISPVQPFIGKTRKLRDHWAASVILSWLTFEGIAAIMDYLGPDHIVYPSLQDQPLVEEYIGKEFREFFSKYNKKLELEKDVTVASFPNKFVFLAPSGKEELFVAEIEKRIQNKWSELSRIVVEHLGVEGAPSETIFNRQTHSWWQFSWSCSNLIKLDNQDDIEILFGKEKFSTLFQTIKKFSESYHAADTVYPVTHSLVQTALAASKNRPMAVREPEPGIKCPVCGELEILHNISSSENSSAGEYKNAANVFWEKLSDRFGESTIKPGEKLCAICSIKRFAPEAIKKTREIHILKKLFVNDKFPSTTEMATYEFRKKIKDAGILFDEKLELKLIDELHEKDKDYSEDVKELLKDKTDEDNYYAILMMDGDKMGDLVNGSTIAAKWRDVLHPELVSRYETETLKEKVNLWKEYLGKQRILSPALHATISESLGAFSLYAVPSIIKKHKGKLIYAGGDDVAAVLPLSSALSAADTIRKVYNMRFASIAPNGIQEVFNNVDGAAPVFLFPGNGAGISISAALLICHHKQPLRGAIEETHRILEDTAKNKTGRNAFAVRLKKRSGHTRNFTAKWNETNPFFSDSSFSLMDSFKDVQNAYADELLSSSLIYHVHELEIMINAVLPSTEELSIENIEKIVRILAYEISHSGNLNKKFPGDKNKAKRKELARMLASHIAGITVRWNKDGGKNGEWEYNGEVPVIARYFARGGEI
jgi:CRISPR-associated protein Cmr2